MPDLKNSSLLRRNINMKFLTTTLGWQLTLSEALVAVAAACMMAEVGHQA